MKEYGENLLRALLEAEIMKIRNQELREILSMVLKELPEAFYTRESSKIYHPEDERGPHGNLIHTLKVCRLVGKIADTGIFAQPELDLMRSRAILHDSLRHGLDGTSKYSTKNHPYLVRQLLERLEVGQVWITAICEDIEKHMGRWGTPSYPTNMSTSDILHLADCLAAQTDIEVKL